MTNVKTTIISEINKQGDGVSTTTPNHNQQCNSISSMDTTTVKKTKTKPK